MYIYGILVRGHCRSVLLQLRTTTGRRGVSFVKMKTNTMIAILIVSQFVVYVLGRSLTTGSTENEASVSRTVATEKGVSINTSEKLLDMIPCFIARRNCRLSSLRSCTFCISICTACFNPACIAMKVHCLQLYNHALRG